MKISRQRGQIKKYVTVEVKVGREEGSKQYTLESSKLFADIKR